ncbi:MAG: 5/3-nucleotidase SurE [Pseudomonadota bacterium]|jgi:5'-nucleotidase|uniref:5'/3'-nucleotidase SurE n=1 Tax=Novosphingobium sp. APW14 TaxID=3077237 RepID=UPI0028DEB5B8|nr:5'/3'-nucleotidase SurE [Novosphingobium sp. APW14]MDT9013914.1 5'/3'-nucleotidase SurE [Novosphingobium sp. APW14]
MRILLTNDDGIFAPGLTVLEAIARQFSDDVWIVAPAEEQSGAGHSLTLSRPVRLREHGDRRFSVSGTPTDAVMMALREIMPAAPDLILSGVNRGANLGDDVTYSGTVSAAIEGALAGIRSIALSQVYASEGMGDAVPFGAAEAWGAKVIAPLLDLPFAPRTLVNINFPAISADQVKGIRVVRQGFHDYSRGTVVEGIDPRGYRYFWFGLNGIEHTPGHATDLEAIQDGFVAVTPLQLDLTHEGSLSELAGRFS